MLQREINIKNIKSMATPIAEIERIKKERKKRVDTYYGIVILLGAVATLTLLILRG